MIRHLQIAGFALAWVCALAGTLHAEKSPRSTAQLSNESDLILVGTILALKVGVERSHVETGFGNSDWAIDLTIGIQNSEKGQYPQAQQTFPTTPCSRVSRRVPADMLENQTPSISPVSLIS